MNTYTFKVRPAYNSDDLLIEFESVTDERWAFVGVLEDELERLDAERSGGSAALPVTDDLVVQYDSSRGPFELDLDSWGNPFILASDNQPAIEAIADVLRDSEAFVEEEADFSEYR